MVRLNEIETNKCNLIFDYYNKILANPLSIEEKNNFVDTVCNISKEVNEDLSEILDICYEFARCNYEISDICDLAELSRVILKIAEL